MRSFLEAHFPTSPPSLYFLRPLLTATPPLRNHRTFNPFLLFYFFFLPSSLIKAMKLVKIGSLFSKISKSAKRGRIESPSFGSVATASSSSEGNITPKSVLPVAVGDLFSVFDRDGDGKISKRELEVVFRRLGPHDPPTEEELASMVAEIDSDGDGCISLDELGSIGPAALGDPAAVDELRDVFAVFDADGDGKISAEELLEVFMALGDGGCTIDDCRRMIVGVDTDGDGFVCFGDFERMMDGKR